MNKKILIFIVVLSLLCFNMPWSFSIAKNISSNDTQTEIVTYQEGIIEEVPVIGFGDDFGVWIYTKYNGNTDEAKLDLDLNTFKLLLDGGGYKQYRLTLDERDDTTVNLQFVRTQIFLEDGSNVDVAQAHYIFETNADTTEDFEVSLEVRFPFSALEKKARTTDVEVNNPIKDKLSQFLAKFLLRLQNIFDNIFSTKETTPVTAGEEYFSMRIGFASPDNDEGPRRVETRFFFGRSELRDPRVFRMKISPTNMDDDAEISYFNSYLTVDANGAEAFYRTFSIGFNPASELQVTSIPRQAKISYNFGHSSGKLTEISLRAEGGALDSIIQKFIVDPLPDSMSFDLTILGERSFEYESDQSYSVTYIVESVQDGNLVKLDLNDLPKRMKISWGLGINLLRKSGSGLIDLDMSSDIGAVKLYMADSEKPFVSVSHFPKKIRLSAFLDIDSLSGSVSLTTDQDATTVISVPLSLENWEITAEVRIYKGFGSVSFNFPSGESTYFSVGFDTNNDVLFGLDLTVVDTSLDKEILVVSLGGFATQNLGLSFNNANGSITNLDIDGAVTKLEDLYLLVDFQGYSFNFEATWSIGNGGLFQLECNEELALSLDDLEFNGLKLSGTLGLHPGSTVAVEWERGQQGFFQVSADGIEVDTAIDFTYVDANTNQLNIYAKLVLNSNCILKFDWEWGDTGHFTVFTNKFLEELEFKVGYIYDSGQDEYQYGFDINAQDVGIVRTIQWDVDGNLPRIWVLGDNPLPGDWYVWLLWNYNWYEVK